MEKLEVIARLKIRPGQLEGFKSQAAEICAPLESRTRTRFVATGSSTRTEHSARSTSCSPMNRD